MELASGRNESIRCPSLWEMIRRPSRKSTITEDCSIWSILSKTADMYINSKMGESHE
jgi:hypothetical protein